MTHLFNRNDKSAYRFFTSFILLTLFLTAVNFANLWVYWFLLSFVLFFFTPNRKLRFDISTAILLIFAIAMFPLNGDKSIGLSEIVQPFSYVCAYVMGSSFISRCKSKDGYDKVMQLIVYVFSFGFLLHYFLNFVVNISITERNTIDFWTGKTLSATCQAALACMSVGVVSALFFSNTSRKSKVLAVLCVLVIILYNLVLAGRTLLFMMVIMMLLAYGYRCTQYKQSVGNGIYLLALLGLALLIYNNDIIGINRIFEGSNFYNRFFGDAWQGLLDDGRLDLKFKYLKYLWDYPFGGERIRAIVGNYAHDLYLDTYDQYGVFAFLSICVYMVLSLVRMYRFLRFSNVSFEIKQIAFCVSVALNIQFWLEPIIQGVPFLLIAYCMVDGVVSAVLENNSTLEVVNE